MIIRKGFFAILLVLALLLAGCVTDPNVTEPLPSGGKPVDPAVMDTTAPDPTEPKPTEPPTTDASGKSLETGLYPEGHQQLFCTLLPKEVDNPDNLPVLKWVVLAHWHYIANRLNMTEGAAVAINRELAARGMPFRIQLEFYSLKDFIIDEDDRLYYDLINFPEVRTALKDADLVSALFFNENELRTYLQPITEYVSASGQHSLKNAVPHEVYWAQATVDGEIYGIPTQYCSPKVLGWDVNERVFKEYGLQVEDFYAQFWEMDEIFAEVYEKNGEKAFLELPGNEVNYGSYNDSYVPQIMYAQLYYQFEQITSCFAIDYTGETPQMVNYLESEYVQKTQKAIARYYRAGYYTRNTLDQHISFTDVDAAFEYLHDVYWWTNYGDYAIPVSNAQFMRTDLPDYISGISVSADQKEHALTLLNLIAEDVEFRKLMLFGVEGEDYNLVNGIRKIIYENKRTQNKGYCMDYLSPLANFCGFKRGINESYPAVEEGSTPLASHQKTLDGCTVWYPLDYYDFDLTGLEEELEAINALLEKKLTSFHIMSESSYEQMLSEIREAGGDKVLAELQRQFDAWLAENPQ